MAGNRRNFILNSGLLAAALGIGSTGLSRCFEGLSAMPPANEGLKPIRDFGLQLWTIKDALGKDVNGTLQQVSGFGYKQIEGFEGAKGLFWGMTNKEFRKLMDDLGMHFISSHCNIKKDFEKKAAQAAEIGMKFLICPYAGPQKTRDDYKKLGDEFNVCGEICKKNGIGFAYHNHGYSFTRVENYMPQDVIMQQTNPALVDFEMDIYWVVAVGGDPVAWFRKYPNRFRLVHVKDRKKDVDAKEMNASCDLGTGGINFSSILSEAKKEGTQYYIVEQERFDNTTSMNSAAADADYMKKLDI